MNIFKRLSEALQYIFGGVVRIFSARDDEYPETGVQPFEGEPFDPHKHGS